MKKLILALVVFSILCATYLSAQTSESEFALFKRTVSPVLKWGENGILTVPKATTIGKLNFYAGALGQQSGVMEGKQLFLTSASLMAGTSDDVELGYTRRQLIWQDLYFTDMSMDTIHFKARVLNFGDYILPQVALGMNGVSLYDNTFTKTNSILFNPYAVATSTIPIFTKKILLSVSAVAETIMNEGALGAVMFSGGVDLSLWKFFYVFGEIQGINLQKANDEVVNAGAKVKLGPFALGVGLFNIIRQKSISGDIIDNIESSKFILANAKWMASLSLELNLGPKKAE